MTYFPVANVKRIGISLLLLFTFIQCDGQGKTPTEKNDKIDSLIDQKAIDALPDSFRNNL